MQTLRSIASTLAAILFFGLFGAGYYLYLQRARAIRPLIVRPVQGITETLNTEKMPLTLPLGFSVSIYARDLVSPRVLAEDPFGNILVSIPSQGRIVLLREEEGAVGESASGVSAVSARAETLLEGLDRPHGLLTRCVKASCTLYVAESSRVSAFTYGADRRIIPPGKVIAELPEGGLNLLRSLARVSTRAGERLLVSIGSSCDACIESDSRRGSILSMAFDGSEVKSFATGLRNTLFFARHPATGELFASEGGRDLATEDGRSDEVNVLAEGRDYGWPLCWGENALDPLFVADTALELPTETVCEDRKKTPARIVIPANSGSLGLAFTSSEGWPKEYARSLLVAYHGSWNTPDPVGYSIVRFSLDAKGVVSGGDTFAAGWLGADKIALGRPVDLLARPGGVLFVSDDKAGVVYRIAYDPASVGLTGAAGELVRLTYPVSGGVVRSPLFVRGEARGGWYFEADFPLRLEDAEGRVLASVPARASGEWMTEEFVPFTAKLSFDRPSTPTGTLILERSNPSGLPEHDASLRIPVRFPAAE